MAGWCLENSQKILKRRLHLMRIYKCRDALCGWRRNHSLVTAKVCYENYKKYIPIQKMQMLRQDMRWWSWKIFTTKRWNFSPIHRIVTETDEEALLMSFKNMLRPNGYPVQWYTKERQGIFYLNPNKSRLAVEILQNFLDEYLKTIEDRWIIYMEKRH